MSDDKFGSIGDEDGGSSARSGSSSDAQLIEVIRLDPTNVTLNIMSFPIVVFYGPREVGKSSIMGSLIYHADVNSKKYGLSFDVLDGTIGSPPDDYLDSARKFVQGSKGRLMIEGSPDFIAVTVAKNKKTAFFILEAPGEHFFEKNYPEKPALRYFYLRNLFLSKENKKVVCYVFSQNMFDSTELQRQYYNNIQTSIGYLKPSDSIVVIATKINETKDQLPMDDELVKSWFKTGGKYEDFGRLFDTCQVKNYKVIPYAAHNILPEENNQGHKSTVQQLDAKYQSNLMRLILEETKEPGFFSKFFAKR